MSNLISAEALLANDRFTTLEIPELGGHVLLRPLAAGEVMDFANTAEGPAKTRKMFLLVSKSLVDEEGNRLLSPAQAKRMGEVRVDVFKRIQDTLVADIKGAIEEGNE